MKYIALAALLFAAAAAQAAGRETTQPAVVYDAPSTKARPLLILSGGYPVKEISRVDGFYKILTPDGEQGWIADDSARPRRLAVIAADRAAVRVDPHPAAAAVFFAGRGVVLEALAAENGWLKVLHKDGEVGYLQRSDSWENF